MNLQEAVKCLSAMSQKLIPKDDPLHGFVSLIHKGGKSCVAVSNDKMSCIIPVEVKNNFTENMHCLFDGKLFSKILQKHDIKNIELTCVFNMDNQASSINIKSNIMTNVSVPVSSASHSIKVKKMSSSFYEIDKESLSMAIKSTIVAGSDVDAERPYYYALMNFKNQNMSITCGNGSFFAFVECKSLNNSVPDDFCLMPIPVASSLIPVLDGCEDATIKMCFDDNSLIIHAGCMKFFASISRKCVSWPDASSIINRKTGTVLSIKKEDLKEVAGSIELAAEGYESKNETLKCNLKISGSKINFVVNGTCKIESSIDVSAQIDDERSIAIDAACIPLSMRSKMLNDEITLNIDDSAFKGRPAPVVLSSISESCAYKTFFAVS